MSLHKKIEGFGVLVFFHFAQASSSIFRFERAKITVGELIEQLLLP
jgi:hypothetical protein